MFEDLILKVVQAIPSNILLGIVIIILIRLYFKIEKTYGNLEDFSNISRTEIQQHIEINEQIKKIYDEITQQFKVVNRDLNELTRLIESRDSVSSKTSESQMTKIEALKTDIINLTSKVEILTNLINPLITLYGFKGEKR